VNLDIFHKNGPGNLRSGWKNTRYIRILANKPPRYEAVILVNVITANVGDFIDSAQKPTASKVIKLKA
jgi:hypothetical protein